MSINICMVNFYKKSGLINTENLMDIPDYSFLGYGNDSSVFNKTLKWFIGDNEELYNRNLKDPSTRQLLQDNGWIDKDIEYKFNERGFRSDTFNDANCEILFNGTSTTAGVGLDEGSMFSRLFADYHKTGHYSIAVPGSDWQAIAQRSAYWITRLKPKLLIVKSVRHRFNWWKKENDYYLMRSTAQFSKDELMRCRISNQLYTDVPMVDIASSVNADWYEHSMIKYHEKICEENGCQLIVIDETANVTDGDLARDLSHYGKIYHAKVFDWLKTQKLNYKS